MHFLSHLVRTYGRLSEYIGDIDPVPCYFANMIRCSVE